MFEGKEHGNLSKSAGVSREFYEKMLSKKKSVTIDPVKYPRNSGYNITTI